MSQQGNFYVMAKHKMVTLYIIYNETAFFVDQLCRTWQWPAELWWAAGIETLTFCLPYIHSSPDAPILVISKQ